MAQVITDSQEPLPLPLPTLGRFKARHNAPSNATPEARVAHAKVRRTDNHARERIKAKAKKRPMTPDEKVSLKHDLTLEIFNIPPDAAARFMRAASLRCIRFALETVDDTKVDVTNRLRAAGLICSLGWASAPKTPDVVVVNAAPVLDQHHVGALLARLRGGAPPALPMAGADVIDMAEPVRLTSLFD